MSALLSASTARVLLAAHCYCVVITGTTAAASCPPHQKNCSSPCPCAPKYPPGGNCTPFCDPRSASDNAWSAVKPNVLLLGDSIAAAGTGYFPDVRTMLAPAATVSNPRAYPQGGDFCGSSFGVASPRGGCLDLAISGKQWDVIHLNWGLHDVGTHSCCPNASEAVSGYAPITEAEYVEHLEAMYVKLQPALTPNGTLIFCTTTPVPASYMGRNDSSVITINSLARTLFGPGSKHSDVLVHDLYSEVVNRCHSQYPTRAKGYPLTGDCPLQPNGVHFCIPGKCVPTGDQCLPPGCVGSPGKEMTATFVAGAIRPHLPRAQTSLKTTDEGAVAASTTAGGRTKRLMLDSRVAHFLLDLELVPGTVVKHPRNPVLSDANPEQARPWEVRYDNMNANVYWDQGMWRMWYTSQTSCDPVNSTRGTPSDTCATTGFWPCSGVPAATVGPAGRFGGLLYAESPDGLEWSKPALRLVNDSTTTSNTTGFEFNNIVRLGWGGSGVLIDSRPDIPTAERYKLFGELNTAHGVGAAANALATSPDGLHWSNATGSARALAPHGTHCNAVWDRVSARYFGFGRVSNNPYRMESVAVSQNATFMGVWGPARKCGLERRESMGYQPDAMVVFPQQFGGVWLAFVNMLNITLVPYNGVAEVELAWSADLTTWSYVKYGTPFIPRGPPGSYDCCQIFGAKQLPVAGIGGGDQMDQMRLYYSSGNGPFMGSRSGALNVATLQKDHWFGYTPTKSATHAGRQWVGELTTANVTVGTMGQLLVSADARRGRVTVGIGGDPSLTPDACVPIEGKVTEVPVRWRHDGNSSHSSSLVLAPLARLVGHNVSLVFKLEPGAVLFAFDL